MPEDSPAEVGAALARDLWPTGAPRGDVQGVIEARLGMGPEGDAALWAFDAQWERMARAAQEPGQPASGFSAARAAGKRAQEAQAAAVAALKAWAQEVRDAPAPAVRDDEEEAEEADRRASDLYQMAQALRKEARRIQVHDLDGEDRLDTYNAPCFTLPPGVFNALSGLAQAMEATAEALEAFSDRDSTRAGEVD